MKKYVKLWPVIVLAMMFLIAIINRRPIALSEIIKGQDIHLVEDCSIELKELVNGYLTDRDVKITQEEFREILEKLDKKSYTKVSNNRLHHSVDGKLYFIYLRYFFKEDTNLYDLCIASDGIMSISINNKKKTYAFEDRGIADATLKEIYQYVSERLESKEN